VLLHTIERENSAHFHHSIKIQNDYTKRIDYCLPFSQIKFPNFPVFSASSPITCKKCSKSILFRHAFHFKIPYILFIIHKLQITTNDPETFTKNKGVCPAGQTPLARQREPPIVKMLFATKMSGKNLLPREKVAKIYDFDGCGKTACFARYFDFLRNSRSTVPLYADERELLVLTASLTSASL
jgi:hypothetical protein